jgi:hypothetical protein
MISKHLRAELGRLFGVTDDARQLSAIRWRGQHAGRTDTPLAERLAAHHAALRKLVRDDFSGLDMLPQEGLTAFIRAGVVDAGVDRAAVEAAVA